MTAQNGSTLDETSGKIGQLGDQSLNDEDNELFGETKIKDDDMLFAVGCSIELMHRHCCDL